MTDDRSNMLHLPSVLVDVWSNAVKGTRVVNRTKGTRVHYRGRGLT